MAPRGGGGGWLERVDIGCRGRVGERLRVGDGGVGAILGDPERKRSSTNVRAVESVSHANSEGASTPPVLNRD